MAERGAPDFSTPEGLAATRDISGFGFDAAGCTSDLGIEPEDRVVRAGESEVEVRIFRPQYMGHVPEAERTNPDISPLFADLHVMPPALFSVGAADGLYEDSAAMAMRWAAAGNECELDVYPDSPHGFDSLPIQMAEAAWVKTTAWLDSRLA